MQCKKQFVIICNRDMAFQMKFITFKEARYGYERKRCNYHSIPQKYRDA